MIRHPSAWPGMIMAAIGALVLATLLTPSRPEIVADERTGPPVVLVDGSQIRGAFR